MTETNVLRAVVDEIVPLTDSILKVVLAPVTYVDYCAGQYLQIILNETVLSFSIANAPLGSRKYEIHIRHSQENPYHQTLLHAIKTQGMLTVQLPYGDCDMSCLEPNRPIIFIAGGTGFAPIKAMIEQLLTDSDTRLFELFWGARVNSDLYMDDRVSQMQAHVPNFRYFAQCSDGQQETLIATVLKQHLRDLALWQFVLSGPFDMVYRMRDVLLKEGVLRKHMFSDAFQFED